MRFFVIEVDLYLLLQSDPSGPEESRQDYQKSLLRKLNERAEVRLTSQGDKVSAEKWVAAIERDDRTEREHRNLELERSTTLTSQKGKCRKIQIFTIWNFISVRERNEEETPLTISALDKRYETVILPINGAATPFHISTIKVSESFFLMAAVCREGNSWFRMFLWLSKANTSIYALTFSIRVVLANKPTRSIKRMSTSKNCKCPTIPREELITMDIIGRTYRASNDKKDDVVPASNNLSHIHKLIVEIQKKFKDQEQERKQMEVRWILGVREKDNQSLVFNRVWSNKMHSSWIQARPILNWKISTFDPV